MKYLVTKDCYLDRYIRAGTVISVPDGYPVPDYFKPLEDNKEKNNNFVKEKKAGG